MAIAPDRLTAATFYGAAGWQLDDLVTQADLDLAQLTGAELAPSRLRANAEQALNSGDWPAIRLPASDAALMDVLEGAVVPRGYLPFELPSSMEAVEAQRPGAAADSENPLYALGYRFEAAE